MSIFFAIFWKKVVWIYYLYNIQFTCKYYLLKPFCHLNWSLITDHSLTHWMRLISLSFHPLTHSLNCKTSTISTAHSFPGNDILREVLMGRPGTRCVDCHSLTHSLSHFISIAEIASLAWCHFHKSTYLRKHDKGSPAGVWRDTKVTQHILKFFNINFPIT